MKKLIFSILAGSMVCPSIHAAAQASSGEALYNELLSSKNIKKTADKKEMDQKQWAEFNDLVSQKVLTAAEKLEATKTADMPLGDSSLRKKLDTIVDMQVVVLKKIQGK